MLKNVLNSIKRRAQFGVEGLRSAPGRFIDERKLKAQAKDARSAINKTGQAFAYRELGPGWERGYDDRVKKRQKDELARTTQNMQEVGENNRKRLERLNNIK